MKQPKNFEKVNKKKFVAHDGKQYTINIDNHDSDALFVLPAGDYKNCIHMVIPWHEWTTESIMIMIGLVPSGMGKIYHSQYAINLSRKHIQSVDHFVEWLDTEVIRICKKELETELETKKI